MSQAKQTPVDSVKKMWTPPKLEVLDVKETAYWEYVLNPDTGFWQEQWVSES